MAFKVIEGGGICGLCRKKKQLFKTLCCGRKLCAGEAGERVTLVSKRTCLDRHRRYTLCSFHSAEKHKGNWKGCKDCRDSFETEIYVWFGTNEYNFEKLENPPKYEPTKCRECGGVIKLRADSYSTGDEGHMCEKCMDQNTDEC